MPTPWRDREPIMLTLVACLTCGTTLGSPGLVQCPPFGGLVLQWDSSVNNTRAQSVFLFARHHSSRFLRCCSVNRGLATSLRYTMPASLARLCWVYFLRDFSSINP